MAEFATSRQEAERTWVGQPLFTIICGGTDQPAAWIKDETPPPEEVLKTKRASLEVQCGEDQATGPRRRRGTT